jgi:nitrous oxidase accessory protein NosD
LIKTRDVLIEGCTIQDTTGTAIHIGAEGSWHEGPASADVRIRYNRIIDCGFGEGTQNHASGVAVNVKADRSDVPGIHKRILIEGNQIRVPDGTRHGIYVSGSEDVTIRYNQISGAEVPIEVQHSEEVNVYENSGAGSE